MKVCAPRVGTMRQSLGAPRMSVKALFIAMDGMYAANAGAVCCIHAQSTRFTHGASFQVTTAFPNILCTPRSHTSFSRSTFFQVDTTAAGGNTSLMTMAEEGMLDL